MSSSDYPVIIQLSTASAILPFLASLLMFRQIKPQAKGFKFLRIYFALAAFTEGVVYFLNETGLRSAWISHIYTLLECTVILLALASWQKNREIVQRIYISLGAYLIIYVLIKALGIESSSASTVNHMTRPLALLLVCFWVFWTLRVVWLRASDSLAHDFRFWALLAMAIYFSASIGLFALMFSVDQGILTSLFYIHAGVNILHNLLFTICVFSAAKTVSKVALAEIS